MMRKRLDKFLSDPKNQSNANAWYYKGKIYAKLAREDSTNTLTYDPLKNIKLNILRLDILKTN